ncbi:MULTISPECIES: aspartyl/asparaginyl beta-hydroxylase domain-containing protein [Serratia]|uniref:Aspartyl/asparaginyl beta-hydroxylase domain-containing protein n=1 Tax=Serratia surfactantfaciens TaxID=2741499 RepID=A0ABS0LZH5_9GAMM|nr:aspartyl/asparaginyl beta-hydroxylase domain-containing protein [Serratia surfactantfaciens]WMW59991.1 aspartyl/asparaginyl beta-hydroxylase domain-containing protein [Serratia marcescens]AOF00085.1 aspartyl beta-hydroxylase [Serratia surfactantfaciens]MBH1920633.1 aspartyl/asparaginyl beta-hydroxylase domain-containing protein [Serratia surfactantfaciens]MBI6152775.1 aspartyl/asparaginyl beta-hydroxylase domain-containing protein [Serratia surfactantfaciens]BEM88124.1 aspartyl beta-hydroxy
MSAIYDWSVLALRNVYDRRIQGQPVLDSAALFPDAERFTAQWRQIREEALTVAHDLHNIPRFHEIMIQQESISANDARDWRMFIMKAYGQPIARNLARCPALAALIASSPDVLSASLSFLAPGKQVPPHRGPFRGILRGYLVLDMPKRADGVPAAVLKVDGREYRLHEGEFMLWDDTFEHEVWNDSAQVRTVLLLDIRRRDMPGGLRLLSSAIIALVRLNVRWMQRQF